MIPDASVAVPTYKRDDLLSDALVSILGQKTAHAIEVLVLDNACSILTKDRIESFQGKTDIPISYHLVESMGLHSARHLAAREARGEIIIYVDDDIIAGEGWLQSILEPFQDPRVAVVGGKILPRWDQPPPDFIHFFHPGSLSLLDLGDDQKQLTWPNGAYGCNMAVRKKVLFELGGFNPDAFGDKQRIWLRGDGETGLHKKIYEAGYQVIYQPPAVVYHRIPQSRMTPKYFAWRYFIQGISDSYSAVRAKPSTLRSLVRLTIASTLAMKSLLIVPFSKEKKVKAKATAWYWCGRAMHQLRVLLSPTLRRHVIRDSYL